MSLLLLSLLLLLSTTIAFTPISISKKQLSSTTTSSLSPSKLQANFFDDLLSGARATTTTTTTRTRKAPKVTIPKDFQLPEPKPLTITDETDILDFLKSSIALALRLGTGAFVLGWKIDTLLYDGDGYSLKFFPFLSIRDSSSVLQDAPRPNKPLILYEYDASPYCKRVREMINILDLTVEYRPCPGARQSEFSNELYKRTGKRTVPYLIDPNTNIEMFESNNQIEYLLETYGPPSDKFDRKALWTITVEPFAIFTSILVAIIRNMPSSKRQINARLDNEYMIPIEIWGYETSPFVRPVREKLCSLCLPHIMISCSRGSINRDKLLQKLINREGSGNGSDGSSITFQVPYIVDPNTGIEMFESNEIVKYLDAVYTTPATEE